MIWFYERKGEHLRCEVRQMIEGDKFALVVTMPDGSERTETFDDSGALNRRSVEELTDFFIREIERGIDDTDIKAGVMIETPRCRCAIYTARQQCLHR